MFRTGFNFQTTSSYNSWVSQLFLAC